MHGVQRLKRNNVFSGMRNRERWRRAKLQKKRLEEEASSTQRNKREAKKKRGEQTVQRVSCNQQRAIWHRQHGRRQSLSVVRSLPMKLSPLQMPSIGQTTVMRQTRGLPPGLQRLRGGEQVKSTLTIRCGVLTVSFPTI